MQERQERQERRERQESQESQLVIEKQDKDIEKLLNNCKHLCRYLQLYECNT